MHALGVESFAKILADKKIKSLSQFILESLYPFFRNFNGAFHLRFWKLGSPMSGRKILVLTYVYK